MAPPVVPAFTAVDGSGQSLAGKNNGVRPQVSRLRNRRNEGKVTTRGGRDTRNEGELEQKKKANASGGRSKKEGGHGVFRFSPTDFLPTLLCSDSGGNRATRFENAASASQPTNPPAGQRGFYLPAIPAQLQRERTEVDHAPSDRLPNSR